MNADQVAKSIENSNRKNRLDWYEGEIRKRANSVASIFLELRNDKMQPWKVAHDSFEDYCREVWGMSPRRMQQMAAGEAVKALLCAEAPDLAPVIQAMPERQLRELAQAPEEKRQEVVRVAAAIEKKITSRTLKQAKAKVIDAATGKPEQQEFSFTIKASPEHREDAEWFSKLAEADRANIIAAARRAME